MKVTEYFANSNGQTLVSFEVLPPLKGGSMQAIFDTLDPLMEFKPPFIDVTYHREEFIYNKMPSGYYEKIAIRKRPGTVGICAAIMHRYGVDAVPHLICGGFTNEETENALIDLNFLDINNVLALRGDARNFDGKFIPEVGGHEFALDLVKQVADMNRGKYLDENIENGEKTSFCVGIAGYPEKHFEAPNLKIDLEFTKAKVDAGADYIVTQMFFDNMRFFSFVERCRSAGIEVPIIPGIKVLNSPRQLSLLPKRFHIDLPDALVNQVTDEPKRVKQTGVDWAVRQCEELLDHGVKCVHFFVFNDVRSVERVVTRLRS